MIGLNIGTPNNHHFPFGTNVKVEVLGVPILKHFRVVCDICCFLELARFGNRFKHILFSFKRTYIHT